MPEKSERRRKLEASLAESPGDVFLRYALSLQCLRDGETSEGLAQLRDLIRDEPDYVAAYHQLGRALLTEGETAEAGRVLRAGHDVASRVGEWHAASEIAGLLEGMG